MPIDKQRLYQTFDRSLERSQRLADMATRKALDLPLDDDMQIITNHTHQGLGRWGALLLSLAMLTGGGGATLGAAGLLGWWNQATPPAVTSSQVPAPAEAQEFKVTFWSEDGSPLEVEEQSHSN